MPEWLEWVLVIVVGGVAVCAFIALLARFCDVNDQDEQREMRTCSRVADRCIGPYAVNGWRQRPEAEPLRGRDLRCYQPIPRRETA